MEKSKKSVETRKRNLEKKHNDIHREFRRLRGEGYKTDKAIIRIAYKYYLSLRQVEKIVLHKQAAPKDASKKCNTKELFE